MATLPKTLINRPISNRRKCYTSRQNSGNGAGKTTLLQIICGITLPTHGSVQVNGWVAPILALGAGFDHELTGRENALIGGAILGLRRSAVEARLPAIAAFA